LHAAFENTLALFKKNNAAIHYYETEGLKQADLIEAQTATAYKSGNINYAEFAALMAQALQIQLNYLDVKHQLNLLQIELEYLKGN
jgi:cobalt-zinc-cadmium resistance protein CzcA